MTDISNTDDIIDSRDVIARIEELETEREALADAVTELETEFEAATAESALQDEVNEWGDKLEDARDALTDWDADNAAELATLRALAEEASGYAADWQYGETLIRDSYFRDYAQELAEDVCSYDVSNVAWPLTCIDWDQAARELQMDYTSVDFDGVTYWIR